VTSATRSAGLLLHRHTSAGREVLIAHTGGPFWAREDEGAWSIPKGEYREGGEPLVVALREFEMEWPRGSGRMRRFPEIDRAEWMPLDRARTKLVKGQVPAIDALARDVLEPADGP